MIVKIICSIYILSGVVQFILVFTNKQAYPAAPFWVMAAGFIITQSLIHASPQIRANTETWNASSLMAFASAIKIKSQLLLDQERVLHSIVVFVFLLFVGQQIAVANSLESSLFGAIIVIGIFLILYHHNHLCSILELAALRREFFQQYIGSKTSKDAFIFYNYSSNKVSLEKGQILKHFDDDITRSTSERLKADEAASSSYSANSEKKKEAIVGDADFGGKQVSPGIQSGKHQRHRKSLQQLDGSSEDDVDVGCLKLQEKSLREIRQEFHHALHKFKELRSTLESRTKLMKESFITGKAVVDRRLYREYKEVDINTSVHNFKGSLRIIKFSGDEDCGIILLRRAEFKLLDTFVQRAQSISILLAQILNSPSFLGNSSYAQPGFVAARSSFVDSPGRYGSNSNLDNPTQGGQLNSAYQQGYRRQPVGLSQNIITNLTKAPPSLNNLQIPGQVNSCSSSPQFLGFNNPNQGNLQLSQLISPVGGYGNMRSFNKLPPSLLSNAYYQHTNLHYQYNLPSMPSLSAFIYQPPPAPSSLQSAQNSAINNASYQNQNGNQPLLISPPLLMAKACVYLYALKYDLREYSLSCRELNCPAYEKYRHKWVSSEVKIRKEYEDTLAIRLGQGTLDQETKNLLKQEETYIYNKVLQDQAAVLKIPQQVSLDVCLEAVIGNDAQIYQLSKKKQGIYSDERDSIEDMYQLRTSLISVRNVLDSLSRILSAGERVSLRFSQDSSINSLSHLSPQEADRLKQVYGDQIIEENSDIRFNSYQTILNNSQESKMRHRKEQEDQELLSQSQEEDIETFRDMLVSLIQQLYNLYKDSSTGFHVSMLKFFTSIAEPNLDLEFRNRFLNAVIKQTAIPFNSKNKPVENNQQQTLQYQQQPSSGNVMPSQLALGKQKPVKSLKNILPATQVQNMKQLNSKQGNDPPNSSEPVQDAPNNQRMIFSQFNKSSVLLKTKMLFMEQQEKHNFQEEELPDNPQKPQQRKINEQLKQVQLSEDKVDDNDHAIQNSLQIIGNNEINMMTEQKSQMLNSNYSQRLAGSLFQQQQQYYLSNQMSQYPKKSVSVQNAHSQLLMSAPHGYQSQNVGFQDINQGESIENKPKNQTSCLENKDVDSPDPQKREDQKVDNHEGKQESENPQIRKLRAARIKIEIQQSMASETYTHELIHSSAYLLQIEEFARFLSPLPMTHRRIPKDKSVTHEYVFYLDNFLYLHKLTDSATEQYLEEEGCGGGGGIHNGEHLSESQKMKKSTNLEGKSIRESRVVSEDKDKILMVSIDAGLGKNKPKKPITAKQRILNKISESLANEEAYEPSEIGSCQPEPPSHSSSQQWQFNSLKPMEIKNNHHIYFPSVSSPQTNNMNYMDQLYAAPESMRNDTFDISSDQRFFPNNQSSNPFNSNLPSFHNGRVDITQAPFKHHLKELQRDTQTNNNNNNNTSINHPCNTSESMHLYGTFTERNQNISNGTANNQQHSQIKRRIYSNVSLLGKTDDILTHADFKSTLEFEEIKTDNDPHANKVYSQNNLSTKIQPAGQQTQAQQQQQHYKLYPISFSNCSTNQHISQKHSPVILPIDSESQMPHVGLNTESDTSQMPAEVGNDISASEEEHQNEGIDERDNKELTEIIERNPQFSILYPRSSKSQSIVLTEDCVKTHSHSKIPTFIGQTSRDSESSFNNRSISPHIIHSSAFSSQQPPNSLHLPQQSSNIFQPPVVNQQLQQQLISPKAAQPSEKKFSKDEFGSNESSKS